MKKDFHVELINAILEPELAQMDYLDNLREETKLSKAGFIAKLKDAYINIFRAFKTLELEIRERAPGIYDITIPYLSFFKFPHLKLFATQFIGPLNEGQLKTLEDLIYRYELNILEKDILKSLKKAQKSAKERDPIINTDNEAIENKFNPLESIWLKSPKLSLDDFLRKGFDLGLWDNGHNLIAKRASVYGSKKSLLANIFISLKGNSINDNIDHKEAGRLFCQFFKIDINPNTENPFKIFQGGNEKQIKELRKAFKINS